MAIKMIGNATENPDIEHFVRNNTSSIAEHIKENPNAGGRNYGRIYKCKDCDKEYDSFQALGGHRASHQKFKTETGAQDFGSGLQSLEQTPPPKLHECRICGKGFAIGQALGGHMRKHREIKINDEEKNSLHKINKDSVIAKIWNTTESYSSSITGNLNGKEAFKYDLNLLPHENESISWGLIKNRKYL